MILAGYNTQPLTLKFDPPVLAFGTRVTFGPDSSGKITAYDTAGNVGTLNFSGVTPSYVLNTAPFAGMRNDRGISRIVIEPDNCNQCFSTMLDRLWLVSPDRVSIDVKPGAEKSVLAADSNAKVSVAILSTACFNAATAVDRTSLTFGRQGTEASILGCSASDVNRDSIPDLDCQFSARAGAFVRGDLVAKLRGRLLSGESIYGAGEVIVK